jgi:hypothetical protein
MPDTITPRFDPNRKSPATLIEWFMRSDVQRNIEPYTKKGILGARTLAPIYMNKYKAIADIWGYTSHPYINYELLSHRSYQGKPLRLFQYFSDPLMRNLQRLSQNQPLVAHDTIDFLPTIHHTIDYLEKEGEGEETGYINWYCGTVLPHFLAQSNIATLLYELADQKWSPAGPNRDDEQVLLFISLVARLFLLLVVKNWAEMRDLLNIAGFKKIETI